jgi:beta-lactamase regulating signal transducer with metallopeptidase domain
VTAIENTFAAVAGLSWSGSLVIVIYGVLRLILRRHVAPRVLFAGWLVIAGLLLLPWRVPVSWHPLARGETATKAPAMVIDPIEPAGVIRELPAHRADAEPAHRFNAETPATLPARAVVPFTFFGIRAMVAREWFLALACLWLAGVGVMLLWQVIADWNLRRQLRGLQPSEDRGLLDALDSARRELGLTSMLPVYVTPFVATPALCGIWRPRLLFPPQFAAGLSASELRFVMLHELGHWRRRDLWLLTLLQVTRAVHWFNPALWLALRFARQDCELACDEFVLRHSAGDQGVAYGETLLKVLGRIHRPASLPGGVSIVENKRLLLKRFAMIMNYHPVGFLRAACGVVLLGGFAVVGATEGKAPAASPVPLSATRPASGTTPVPEDMARRRQEMLAQAQEWEANVKLELRAVGEVGGVPVALIDVAGEPQIMMKGSGIMGLRVGEIDMKAQTATIVDRSGAGRLLPLTNPRAIEFPKVDAQWFLTPEALARRREARAQAFLPSAVLMAWPKINREGKEEILLNYLREGTVVVVRVDSSGRANGGSMGFLFAEQERQILRERREKFVASLTPEQRAEYGNGAEPLIRFTDPPAEREQQAAKAKEAKERIAKVIAGLTPEQKALYDDIMGPAPSRPAGR